MTKRGRGRVRGCRYSLYVLLVCFRQGNSAICGCYNKYALPAYARDTGGPLHLLCKAARFFLFFRYSYEKRGMPKTYPPRRDPKHTPYVVWRDSYSLPRRLLPAVYRPNHVLSTPIRTHVRFFLTTVV
jgi:hypothetical protein